MSDVSFDNEENPVRTSTVQTSPRGITYFVISIGLAKAQKDAEYILLSTAILLFIAATTILVMSEYKVSSPPPQPGSPQYDAEFTPHLAKY